MNGYPREVLVSPGWGAGWSSWAYKGGKFAAENKLVIDFIKAGGKFIEHKNIAKRGTDFKPWEEFEEPGASILKEFFEQYVAETGDDHFYFGGAHQLVVCEVHGPYRIEDYDGNESIVHQSGGEWW